MAKKVEDNVLEAPLNDVENDAEQADDECMTEVNDSSTQPPQSNEGDEFKNDQCDEDGNKNEEEELITLDESQDVEAHPFATEIENYEFTPSQMQKEELGPVDPVKGHPFDLVNESIGLIKLVKKLRTEEAVAVDLEWDTGDMSGDVVMLLVSASDCDYAIDAIALRSELMALSDIFTNPSIVKVVHDLHRTKLAYLQHVLHLYIVNMFDVSVALATLKQRPINLRSLLWQRYSFARTWKYFKLRERPLTPQAQIYVQSGTHFLLHLYRELKNDLLDLDDESVYLDVLNRCRERSISLHEHLADSRFLRVVNQVKLRHHRQIIALKELHLWRKKIAAIEKEKAESILGRSIMKEMVRQLSDVPHILSSITKRNHYVQQHMSDVVKIMTGCIRISNLSQMEAVPVSDTKGSTDSLSNRATRRHDARSPKRSAGRNTSNQPIRPLMESTIPRSGSGGAPKARYASTANNSQRSFPTSGGGGGGRRPITAFSEQSIHRFSPPRRGPPLSSRRISPFSRYSPRRNAQSDTFNPMVFDRRNMDDRSGYHSSANDRRYYK